MENQKEITKNVFDAMVHGAIKDLRKSGLDKVSNKVIPPGKTVSLQIKFDPNFHEEPPGRFSRTVFLKTSEGVELQAKIYVQIKD